MVEDIRFDDIERLKGKVSDTFGAWSEPVEVTQDMINRFAEVTGDHQWIHVDVERAKRESPFGGTVAHGFLTLSLLPRLHGSAAWKLTGYGNATNYGANKLR
ncbi:MAG: MaoC family dehydratase, partial [Deltaproteobacteria bacterium]